MGSGRYAGARFMVLSEEAENDNDKTLTFNTDIAANIQGGANNAAVAEILWWYVEYTTDGTTAGTRALEARMKDSSGDIIAGFGGLDTFTETADFNYMFGRNYERIDPLSVTPGAETLPHNLVLLPGQSLQFLDRGGIDPNDEMILHTMLAVYS